MNALQPIYSPELRKLDPRQGLPVSVPMHRAPAVFGLSADIIRRYADEGKIRRFRLGKHMFVDSSSLLAFIDSLPAVLRHGMMQASTE